MAFYVGQKVVCVDAAPREWPAPTPLIAGEIYTIKKIFDDEVGCGVLLAEVAPTDGCTDFWADRFRPLVEKKTSIEIFQRMLLPVKEDANV